MISPSIGHRSAIITITRFVWRTHYTTEAYSTQHSTGHTLERILDIWNGIKWMSLLFNRTADVLCVSSVIAYSFAVCFARPESLCVCPANALLLRWLAIFSEMFVCFALFIFVFFIFAFIHIFVLFVYYIHVGPVQLFFIHCHTFARTCCPRRIYVECTRCLIALLLFPHMLRNGLNQKQLNVIYNGGM